MDADAAPVPEETIPDEEIIRQTAPTFPWEIVFHSSTIYYQRLPGGGMAIKIAATVPTPNGSQAMPPGIVVMFDAGGWERFKKHVADDGKIPPPVQVVTPGRMLT